MVWTMYMECVYKVFMAYVGPRNCHIFIMFILAISHIPLLRYKRYIFNTYLSYINYQSKNDFLFQECTLSEAAIQAKINALQDVAQCSKYKSKWMLGK